MKIYFIAIVILLTLTTALAGNCQSNVKEAHFKFGERGLRKFLEKKFSEEVKAHRVDVCMISVTFARFSIDTAGNIKDLTFFENKDTPPVFREILGTVINDTNGMWAPTTINDKAVESKPFILPLIYEMEAGCKEPVVNGSTSSILGFLDFGDSHGKKISQLDCVLLSPLRMFSQN